MGISSKDPNAFDQLLRRIADHGPKTKDLQDRELELKRIAPGGIEPLRLRVRELETTLKNAAPADPKADDDLPADPERLVNLLRNFNGQIEGLNEPIRILEAELEKIREEVSKVRGDLTDAKGRLAASQATANIRQEELERLRTEVEVGDRVHRAGRALADAEDELKRSELTAEEATIDQRLAEARDALEAIRGQIRENEEKYNRIKGRVEGSEGLHADRAALAVSVDELARQTIRQSLEKDAVDRLYELFEECREKQLGTLMGPIQDRVLSWMRVLDLGDYKEVRFGDSFLPDKLVRRDGTGEFDINEESTGAQEQIGMLVRVALGSLLTKPDEPAVAILDDPLTHCDIGRLNKMRAILRRAAEGDSNLNPPAGPLQVIILTCHPEWFRDERATVIDLENPDVMQRFAV